MARREPQVYRASRWARRRRECCPPNESRESRQELTVAKVEVEVIRNAYKGVPKPCHQKLAAKWEDLRMMLTPVREKPKDASELKPTK